MVPFQTSKALERAKDLFSEGTSALESGDIELAEAKLSECLSLAPNRESTKQNLAIVYKLKADSLANKGELGNALQFYDEALALNQNFALVLLNKGILLNEGFSLVEAAITCFEKSLQITPNFIDAHLNLGVCYIKRKEYLDAIGHFDQAISLDSGLPDVWFYRGNTLNDLKRHAEALVSYDRAVELKHDFAEAWSNRGNTLNDLKRYEEALVSYDRAVELKHDFAEAWSNRGNTLNDLKRYEEALVSYDRAVELKHDFAEAFLNRGNSLNDLKRYEEALSSYDRAVELRHNYPEAWRSHGITLNNLKRHEEALASFDRAIELKPNLAEAWSNRGNTLNDLKRHEEALASFDRAIELKPDLAESWNNRGAVLSDSKRYQEALTSFGRAIELRHDYPEAWSNRGNTLNDLKRHEDALASYNRAIEFRPDLVEAWSNRGNTLNNLKRHEEALASFDLAIELKPDLAEAWSNRGNTLNNLKRHEEALASFDRAIELKPDLAESWNNRGAVLSDLKRCQEALTSFGRAIELRHDYPEAWSNRGNTLNDLKRHEDALVSYNRAIELRNDYAEAWSNRGVALNDLNRHEEARDSYKRAINLKPDAGFVLGDLVHTQMKICDWTDLAERCRTIEKKLLNGGQSTTPFVALGIFDNPQLHKQCAEIYSKHKLGPTCQAITIPKRARKDKIRIGYFSMDFRNHPVSQLMAELIECHNRNKFEVYGFSFGPNTNDPMRQRLEKSFDKFFEVRVLNELDIARLSQEQEVDIAIDLGGYTQDSRPKIFAYRAAPIQINYLGFPGTMGTGLADYFIGDQITITDENREQFSEKIIFLPNSFQPNPSQRPLVNNRLGRKSHQLPENVFVFCCFNNTWKITPDIFGSWIRILKSAKNSVLWISQTHPTSTRNLLAEFESKGISSSRIIFASRLPDLSDHIARYQSANLFLDTFPYGAHTTASDALWAGLPLLTRPGKSFASRVAASLLHAIKLPQLITSTPEEYESVAINFANNPLELAAIKARLEESRYITPLFNTHLFTQYIESAYHAAYDRYHEMLPPDHIFINP